MPEARFIDQLVDWKDFERFVADMFGDNPDLVVEHDVTEFGKSGARRQIDVRITHRVGGMTYVTLVECKRWKQPVDRSRIDVLAAAIQDLNASKGVLFTTSGFEEGAERYARDQGVELFVVRDLTDEEWGLPGRIVSFWWQFVTAAFGRIELEDPQLASVVEAPPTFIRLDLRVTKDAVLDDQMVLHSVIDGEPGRNLMAILLEARRRALDLLARDPTALGPHLTEAEKWFLMLIELDFTRYPDRQLLRTYGAIKLSRLSFELVVHIARTRFRHDRGEKFDFALAVENYLTRERSVVTRTRSTDKLDVFRVREVEPATIDATDVISEDTMLCVFTEPWVGLPKPIGELFPTRKLTFDLPSWDVTASEVPQRYKASGAPDNSSPATGNAERTG
jgi:hypothetical protein